MASRILVISDLHFELSSHRGIDESVALKWLHKIVDKEKPEVLVGLGDWGCAWKPQDWIELLGRVRVHAIYGNHDNFSMLKSLKNLDGASVLAEDGEVRTISGLQFGFINGIVSETHTSKEGIPRKTSQFFVQLAQCLKNVNVLCTHEGPRLPDNGDTIIPIVGTEAARKAIETSQPDLALNGHLHLPTAFTVSSIGSTTVVRVDSSQQERHYAIIEPEKQQIQIFNDSGQVSQHRFLKNKT